MLDPRDDEDAADPLLHLGRLRALVADQRLQPAALGPKKPTPRTNATSQIARP